MHCKIILMIISVATFGIISKCYSQQISNSNLDWWKSSVFYQIYPRSFKDSDGDGTGDLQGIIQKLDHLKDAGIHATWLSPIFKSPMVDAGYDISDFRDVDPIFGTLADLDQLFQKAKELGIKVILDFVPNHTSDLHEWFLKSVNRTPGYEDYFVWRDGKLVNGTRQPPNNWLSTFGGKGWTFNEKRGQYYYHQYASAQPDLNYRNPKVVEEMKDVLRFWLDRGVSGFRVDAIRALFEDIRELDEPLSGDPNALPTDFDYLDHIYTKDQPETFDMVYQWRDLLDEYSKTETKIMMTEAYSNITSVMKYYGDGKGRNGAHFSFNFLLIADLNENSTAHDISYVIHKWYDYMPVQYTANWVLGNHDRHRVGTRFGKERIDGFNMIAQLLPGIGVTYNGEEIGMVDGFVSWEQSQDPQAINAGPDRYLLFTRDPERTPFQWDNSTSAGFSTNKTTWLPVNDNYLEINLAAQKVNGIASHYHVYQQLLEIRKEDTFKYGDVRVKPLSDNLVTFVRELPQNTTYVVLFNIGKDAEMANLSSYLTIPEKAQIRITSVGAKHKVGETIDTRSFTLSAYEAYVIRA